MNYYNTPLFNQNNTLISNNLTKNQSFENNKTKISTKKEMYIKILEIFKTYKIIPKTTTSVAIQIKNILNPFLKKPIKTNTLVKRITNTPDFECIREAVLEYKKNKLKYFHTIKNEPIDRLKNCYPINYKHIDQEIKNKIIKITNNIDTADFRTINAIAKKLTPIFNELLLKKNQYIEESLVYQILSLDDEFLTNKQKNELKNNSFIFDKTHYDILNKIISNYIKKANENLVYCKIKTCIELTYILFNKWTNVLYYDIKKKPTIFITKQKLNFFFQINEQGKKLLKQMRDHNEKTNLNKEEEIEFNNLFNYINNQIDNDILIQKNLDKEFFYKFPDEMDLFKTVDLINKEIFKNKNSNKNIENADFSNKYFFKNNIEENINNNFDNYLNFNNVKDSDKNEFVNENDDNDLFDKYFFKNDIEENINNNFDKHLNFNNVKDSDEKEFVNEKDDNIFFDKYFLKNDMKDNIDNNFDNNINFNNLKDSDKKEFVKKKDDNDFVDKYFFKNDIEGTSDNNFDNHINVNIVKDSDKKEFVKEKDDNDFLDKYFFNKEIFVEDKENNDFLDESFLKIDKAANIDITQMIKHSKRKESEGLKDENITKKVKQNFPDFDPKLNF